MASKRAASPTAASPTPPFTPPQAAEDALRALGSAQEEAAPAPPEYDEVNASDVADIEDLGQVLSAFDAAAGPSRIGMQRRNNKKQVTYTKFGTNFVVKGKELGALLSGDTYAINDAMPLQEKLGARWVKESGLPRVMNETTGKLELAHPELTAGW